MLDYADEQIERTDESTPVQRSPGRSGHFQLRHEIASLRRKVDILDNESRLLHALMDQVPDYLWIKDTAGRFVAANKALAVDNALADGAALIGKTDFDLHEPKKAKAFFASEQAIFKSGQPMLDHEEYVLDSTGRGKWLSSTKIPVRGANGEITGLVGIARNITERKRSDHVRLEQARILELIAVKTSLQKVLDSLVRMVETQIEGVCGSVLLLDADGIHLRQSSVPKLPDGLKMALDGVCIAANANPGEAALFLQKAIVVKDVICDPIWADHRDLLRSMEIWSCWLVPILSHSGMLLGAFAMYSRYARRPAPCETAIFKSTARIAGIAIERQQAEDRIQFLAHHDVLTGLPNRAVLNDRLSQAILNAQRNARSVTVAFLDLDNFKMVNDSLGHTAGDELLKTIARRIAGCLRASDTVVRLGGDEFVILLPDQPADARAGNTIFHKKLEAAIGEKVTHGGVDFQVTCSTGIASFPADGFDADTLLKHADSAMYAAKNKGRDNVQFYTSQMSAEVDGKLSLHDELRKAVARGEFHLLYQPQVDMRTGRIFALEALVRWDHPARGIVAPSTFIPVAEETGLIVAIGDWVLRTACRQNKAWQDAGLPPVTVCVNVSARQFREKTWVGSVVATLQDSGLKPEYLELEITESMILHNDSVAIAKMQELGDLGVRFAIDDFGTGYSNLGALQSYPVSRLKIDRSFVGKLPGDENDIAIARAVISLGQQMNMRVIAEGVETEQQLALLKANNCDEMQGYLFSRPVPVAEVARLFDAKLESAGSGSSRCAAV